MKKLIAIIATCFFISSSLLSQNVGINNTNPDAALDIYGDVIFRVVNIIADDGITLSMNINSTKSSYYRVAGPTADFTIAGIVAGIDGRTITLFNRSGFAMQLNNEDVSASLTDQIVTGNNADLIISNKGIVTLQYDAAEEKWIVKSSSKIVPGPTGGYPVHMIGESYGGGIVFYVYDGGQHGLIAGTADLGAARWHGGSQTNTCARAEGVGAGLKNTAIVVANQGPVDGSTFAARICNEYSITVADVTYGDWYLPSKFELNLLYLQKDVVGGFGNQYYWSSSEADNVTAWAQYFVAGTIANHTKFNIRFVRPIRSF